MIGMRRYICKNCGFILDRDALPTICPLCKSDQNPFREMTEECPNCQTMNSLDFKYCRHCGISLPRNALNN